MITIMLALSSFVQYFNPIRGSNMCVRHVRRSDIVQLQNVQALSPSKDSYPFNYNTAQPIVEQCSRYRGLYLDRCRNGWLVMIFT